MKVFIAEDEPLAADRLKKLISSSFESVDILKMTDTVAESVNWLSTHSVDLLFLDIQLADGLSFEIFDQIELSTPVIFTTAFNEYAIEAFKVNSIDYLLKPIDPEALKKALAKYFKLHQQEEPPTLDRAVLQEALNMLKGQHKKRFVVKVGEHIKALNISDVLHFYSQNKGTYLVSKDGKKYLIDYTLEQVEQLVDPEHFFRINRKFIVTLGGVQDMVAYSQSRLRLKLHHNESMEAIVSRERVQEFKKWLDA